MLKKLLISILFVSKINSASWMDKYVALEHQQYVFTSLVVMGSVIANILANAVMNHYSDQENDGNLIETVAVYTTTTEALYAKPLELIKQNKITELSIDNMKPELTKAFRPYINLERFKPNLQTNISAMKHNLFKLIPLERLQRYCPRKDFKKVYSRLKTLISNLEILNRVVDTYTA